MPSTTRARGKAGAAAVSDGGNFLSVEPQVGASADSQLSTEQDNMSDPKDLMDPEIVRLRASIAVSRKLLDDQKSEINEQVKVVNEAKERNGPKAILIQYTKILEVLLKDGDKILQSFNESNNSLLPLLEMLLLRLEGSNPDGHKSVESVRNLLVTNTVPYKGMFRKLRVQHEGLLSILLEDDQNVASAPAAAPAVVHSRKEYNFLKPVMLDLDCTKRELVKFIKDAKTWLSKTLTEDETQEPGMVLAVIRSVLDSGWTETLDRVPGIEKMSYE